MNGRRVVITGLGVISPVGSGKDAFWESLTSGRAAFAPVSSFDATGYRAAVGAEVKDSQPREAAAYALACSRQAIADADLDLGSTDLSRAGVALGTTSGEIIKLEKAMEGRRGGRSWEEMLGDAFPDFPGSIPAKTARALGFCGPNVMLTTACCGANAALACAYDKIRWDRTDVMLAGGVDVFNRLNLAGFNRLLAVSPDVCAPFSKGRKGLIPGEGCAVLVLEELERAAARGARIYAEFLGYGLSSDAAHVTMPDVGGISRAIAGCLEASCLAPGDVDYISAHGTGTPANDRLETAAIKKVFGAAAAMIPVSSIKSMVGHAMGAASAMEAAACCLALETGLVPPTINFTGGDPDCDLDYVPEKTRRVDPVVVLSNAFAFGGSNAVIALGKPGRPARGVEPAHRVVVTGIGTVDDKDPLDLAESLLPDKDLSFIDTPMAYALGAAKRALDDAALAGGAGIILDSSGEMESLYKFHEELAGEGPSAVEPRLFPNILANAAASRVAIAFGLKGLNWSLAGSFPGGEAALSLAYDFLSRGRPGPLLAGAVGDGGCLFVVESLAEAQKRGARIYAELAGYGESFDPSAAPRRDIGCFCLASALAKFSGSPEKSLAYSGRGLWGGSIEFDFRRPS